MFLTNNTYTISNLLVYSNYKHAYKVMGTPEFSIQNAYAYDHKLNNPDYKIIKILSTDFLVRGNSLYR